MRSRFLIAWRRGRNKSQAASEQGKKHAQTLERLVTGSLQPVVSSDSTNDFACIGHSKNSLVPRSEKTFWPTPAPREDRLLFNRGKGLATANQPERPPFPESPQSISADPVSAISSIASISPRHFPATRSRPFATQAFHYLPPWSLNTDDRSDRLVRLERSHFRRFSST